MKLFTTILAYVLIVAFLIVIVSLIVSLKPIFSPDVQGFNVKLILSAGFVGVIASAIILVCQIEDIRQAIIKKLNIKDEL